MSTDDGVPAWRFFDVTVARTQRLSPSFVRVTFTGADLEHYADLGYDARTKLLFPDASGGYAHLPSGTGWLRAARLLPEEHRNPMRTYTTRAVRTAQREVDIDLVLHGDAGPASRWAGSVAPGDTLVLLGPNAAHPGPHGGVELAVPAPLRPMLLAGDETAVPAICTVLEQLPEQAQGVALMEVPDAADRWEVTAPAGVEVRWLARDGREHGDLLDPAVRNVAAAMTATVPQRRASAPSVLEEVDLDESLLWEVPSAVGDGEVYAWLAGEAGVITRLRRHLVSELGVDRAQVAFMGYWRQGRPEN